MDYRAEELMGRGALIGAVEAPALHVMSWNICQSSSPFILRARNRWPRRAPRLEALLRAERPTLLGAQEAQPEQVAFLRDCLGEHYRVLGRGRDAAGDDEACPILYDTRRLELVDWWQSALSDTPQVPGSTSWGNLLPRVMVCAVLRGRAGSGRLLAVNTHLDHLSRRARVRSAQAIRQVVAETGLPAVVTGDLNDSADSEPLRELLAGGLLTDAWQTARDHDSELWGTFGRYRQPRPGGRRLDWVLVSPELEVQRAAINPRRHDDGWASDHLPVQVVLRPDGLGEDRRTAASCG